MDGGFVFSVYEVVFRVQEPLRLPPFKGSALRGSFGSTLKRICCQRDPRTCDARPPACACPYGFLFEPKTPPDSPGLRAGEEAARPFVIEPPLDARQEYLAGEPLPVRLLLFGRARELLPYFLVTLRELPLGGRPPRRGRVALEEVWSVDDLAGGKQRVFQAADRVVRNIDQPIAWEDLALAAALYPRDRLDLEFQTNTLLRYQSRDVRRLEFHILISRLLQRVETLAALYGDPPAQLPLRVGGLHPRDLLRAAREVAVVEDRTRWNPLERYSSRQRQKVPLGGLLGRIACAGDLAPFLPLLLLGQYTHVGKGCVFGLGKYRVLRDLP